MTITLSTAAANAGVNAAVDMVDGGPAAGKLRIYNGAKPASPDTAVTTQTLLCELPLSDPGFAAAVNRVKTLDVTPIPQGTGVAAGTASWFRMLTSDNVAHIDGSAGEAGSGADLILASDQVDVGLVVEVTAATLTWPV